MLVHALMAAVVLAQVAPVRGTVRADSSLVPLADATVEVVELERAVATDAQGRFVFSGLPAGTWTLRASAVGYRSWEERVELPAAAPVELDFRLPLDPVQLPGIHVDAARLPEWTGPPSMRLTIETLTEVPALVEADVLRAVSVLPAVAPVSDYSTALYVRGGTPDQVEILLDGFPVHNPYHLAGVYGAFNPAAVSSVELVPGAMPASLGSRISGLVRVETRTGGRNRLRGNGHVGLMSSGLELDGPAPGLPGSFLVSGRMAYRGFSGGGLSGEGILPRNVKTGFDDVLAKWTVPWGGVNVVEALWFSTGEWIGLPTPNVRYDWGWGSRVFGVRSSVTLGPTLTVRARAGSSSFESDLGSWWEEQGKPDLRTVDARGSMADHLAAAELTWRWRGHALDAGAELRSSSMDYDAYRVLDPPGGLWEEFIPRFQDDFSLPALQTWAEADLALGARLGARIGLRATRAEGFGWALGPRAGLRLGLADGLDLTVGGGRHVQSTHTIRVEEAAGTSFLAYDLLRPATAEIGLPTSEDVVVGAELRRGPFHVRVDAFDKRYSNLALPPLPTDPWNAQVIETRVFEEGQGRSRGTELLADYLSEPMSVWLSWAFHTGTRTQDGITYRPRYQRRHSVDLMTAFMLPDDIRLSVRTMWASGQPTTPVVGRLYPARYSGLLGGFEEDRALRRSLLGDHNSITMPRYLRVDVGGRVDFDYVILDRLVDFSVRAQMINALNITNTAYWDPSTDPRLADDPVWQLPPTLTVGLDWRF